ncbi:unnamed protein product [Pocillopora meandrina]|uniref:Uncharacterized protein n=1 Tax=Pocillopora meandrina TaxID=46732 RepID=A0AAU9X088_9CNID|nr:unnamed protein product [Pocillopora meandrina]
MFRRSVLLHVLHTTTYHGTQMFHWSVLMSLGVLLYAINRRVFIRDFGTHTEQLVLDGTEWKEIAFVTRNKVFKDTEQEDIDFFDIKCKEWGFLLKEPFGSSLGTGDYSHLTIDHAPMLRRFL